MIAAAFLFLYVVVQLVICINSMLMNARDGLCTDENVSFLAFLDASGNAARSNFIPSIVLTTVTSSLPFVLLYVVPLLEISIRRDMKPILRDGATSWALLMVVELLKYLIREPRPSAYYTCISSHESWGMPSGHSTWTVGLWCTPYYVRIPGCARPMGISYARPASSGPCVFLSRDMNYNITPGNKSSWALH